MLQHPWMLLAEYLKESWYTQKDFSVKIGKKTSEINELIRWKRNITVAWDIILTKYLSTDPKFWILKQVDYDYEQALLKDGEYDVNERIVDKPNDLKQQIDKTNLEDKKQPEKNTLQDVIDEERRQSQYLRENVFQEAPIYTVEEKVEEKKEISNETKNIPIEELLKEDPIIESTPLSQVFDSF